MNVKTGMLFVCLLNFMHTNSQSITCHKGRVDVGFETQIYPAGILPTITANYFFVDNLALRIRTGANFANRRDYSPYNDNEVAEGYGASAGLVSYFPYKKGHFTAGFTTDIWKMWTDWKDDLNTSNPTAGSTYTLVLQPWADVGYLYNFSNTRLNLGLTLGFGKEINIVTKGEKVGEGWMSSATVTFNYILRQ